jgi:hypothetical protein
MDGASTVQIVRPRESMADTQPQLQPALLRSSAMISQHLTRKDRSICSYGGHWVTYVPEGILSCMMGVEESFSRDCYNRVHSQPELTGLEALEPCSFGSPTENNFSKCTPVITKGHFCQNVSTLCARGVP